MNISLKCLPPYAGALEGPPTANDEGYGAPDLASHDTLETNCYIRGDAIIIKLTVHVENA